MITKIPFKAICLSCILFMSMRSSLPVCDTTFFATFDFEAWRGDVRGCNYVRWGQYKEVLAHEDCFIGMDTLRLKELLGEPDFHFYKKNSFSYCYWLECGPPESLMQALSGKYSSAYFTFWFMEKEKKLIRIESAFP